MAAPVLQFKRGNFSALPGLQAGEPGWVVDEFDLFVGIDSTTNNNKIVGSARYWERETATTGSAVRLVEGANNGDHYVALKSPAALTGNQDYILPASATAGGYLKVDGSGNMSWSTEVDIDTPLSVLDIDGGTDIGADITDADLFIVDDGGGGTNRKTAASRLKTYVLGGGSGASFAAISVSGIGTVTFADTTTLKVAAGATVTGALDVDGGANVAGGLTVTGSQTVDQLTVSGVATATTFDGALATTNLTGTITNAQLAGSIANDKLANSTVAFGGVTLALGAADATPAFDLADATNYPTGSLVGTITNAQLAGSIANAKLANSSINFGGVNLDLGQTDATPAFNLSDATNYPTSSLVGTISNAQLTGNITNAKLVNDSVSFGGVEVALGAADATPAFDLQDATNLPTTSLTGTITNAQLAGSIADSKLNTVSTANKVALSALDIDGATATTSVVDADLLVVDDGANGTNRKVTASNLKDYMLGGGAGANFAAINVTGISTVTFAKATTLTVGAGATVTGALDVDGGANIASGLTVGGVVNGTAFHTGAEGSAIRVTSDTISGPATLTIDPAAVGDDTGKVVIAGDLQVDGTTTTVNSTVVNIVDKNIQVATGAADDSAANGAGITVDSGDGDKTFQFEATGDNWGASENINLASGKVLKVNNTEILSATALSSSVVVDVASVNIDGATDIGADLVDADLLLVDDGAGGTNRKTAMSRVKEYVLGGGAGANFNAISVSGIGTVTFADTTTLKVGAGATVTGALDVDGGANIASGLTVTGGATLNSAAVSDLTDGRVVLAGSGGELEDSGNLTFDGSTLAVTGAATVSTDLTVTQELTARDASLRNVVSSGVVTATDVRNAAGGLIPMVGVSSAGAHTGIVTNFKFTGTGLEAYKVEDGQATITVSGVAATTFSTSQTITATQGQTSYTVSAGFTEGFCDVYHNGVRLITGTDYTQGSDGSTITLATGATVGDELEFVSWKSLGDIVHVQSLKTAGDLTVAGVATATGGFVGDLTGDVTGTVSSGSGLSAGTVPLSSLDIDGGNDIGADLVDADLLIVDDGANGTNRKTAMSRVKSYVLGGGSGATFAQINVTGIATNTFLKSTTGVVGAGLTVGGALDGNGGANISGGETVLSSATVSDLTAGRVVVAGGSGALTDDGNFTWDGSTLGVAGAINGSGGATITGGETVMSSATVSDLTSGRVVLAGASGALGDSGGLTYNGSTLAVTGAITASGNMTVSGDLVVEGSTTQINTTNTTIEDVLLELQKVDGGALSGDTNKDVGIVMNYYSGSAKKAAVYWDDSAARFVLASEATENSGVMTPSAYGGLEIGSLYLNDCAGQSQVISCSGTTRSLENITIDGGSF